MKSQELRIGNFIEHKNMCCRVANINPPYIDLQMLSDNDIYGGLKDIPIEDIKPIPISKEILMKNGFTDNGEGQFYYHLKDKGKTTIRCATNNYKRWLVMVDSMRYENFISTDASNHNAQYVHELQNVIQMAKVDEEIISKKEDEDKCSNAL